MRRLPIITAALLSLGMARVPSAEYATASHGIADLEANFWVGSPSGGHFVNGGSTDNKGQWAIAHAYAAEFGWWKITGSPTALARLTAHWNWLKASTSLTDWNTCGASSTQNYAQDDTAWNAGMLLQAYEVTNDSTALTWAKAAIDCARSRWLDSTFGGWWYYDDTATIKSGYGAIMLLDELRYYQDSGDASYLTLAQTDEAWAQSHLKIAAAHNSISPVGDNLYWVSYSATGCSSAEGPVGCPWTQTHTNMASSATMLVANMAMALVDARLYAITQTTSYLTQAQATAAAIQQVETNAANPAGGACSGVNVFVDDRDARVDGYVAYQFASEVVPKLPTTSSYPGRTTFATTSIQIAACDRTTQHQYTGDWQGPASNGVWQSSCSGNCLPSHIEVSAGAVNFLVAAAVF